MRDALSAALLLGGVSVHALACLGVAVMSGPFERLHYLGASSVAAPLVAAAILVEEGFSLIGNKALLLAAFLAVSSPVLVHATARALRIRKYGALAVRREERVEESA